MKPYLVGLCSTTGGIGERGRDFGGARYERMGSQALQRIVCSAEGEMVVVSGTRIQMLDRWSWRAVR